MNSSELAISLKPGDRITTILDRDFVVGQVHCDPDGYWIEPEGADEYTWWIPVANVRKLNGVDVITA